MNKTGAIILFISLFLFSSAQADFISNADLDSNGKVDFADYAQFVNLWLQGNVAADISDDAGIKIVDYEDITAFSDRWLQPEGIIAYWKLDEIKGNVAYDSAGDYDGSLHANPTWYPNDGKIKGALAFDGAEDFVDTDFVLSPVNGAFSVNLWIKGNHPGGTIISQQTDSDSGIIWLGTDATEGFLLTTLTDGKNSGPLVSNVNVADNLWHYVSLEWDGKRRSLYVDSQQVASDTAALGVLKGTFGGLLFGASPDRAEGKFWSGMLDNIQILDMAERTNETALLESAKNAQEAHTEELLEIEGIVGTAVGFSVNREPVVKVLAVDSAVTGVPDNLDGIPVETVITGEFTALDSVSVLAPGDGTVVDRTIRFDRPVPIGVSTGHPDITAGTIGCRVIDGDGNVYALSNNHIYANMNQASIGDPAIQPGTYDGGVAPDDQIGTLADFEPLSLSPLVPNTYDAAIALSSVEQLGNSTPEDGYGTPRSKTMKPHVHFKVRKYGRTTGLTEGTIEALNATIIVFYTNPEYDPEDPLSFPLRVLKFTDQILVAPGDSFVRGGDSGSLVVSRGKKPVGLVFAGSVEYGVVCPIEPVLQRFNVTIDGD